MKPVYRNLFLLFGVVSIVVMACTFNVDWNQLWTNMGRVGMYMPAVIGVWVAVYACNAAAFQLIINHGHTLRLLPYHLAYKLTVSGFAFSYTTPFGFGGAPYRVMELSGYIGTNRAMSSVVLYSMMHILSHFCLWATAALLYIAFYKVQPFMWTFILLFFAVFVVAVYFFYKGYKNGLVVKFVTVMAKVPLLKKYVSKFYEKNKESLKQIDEQIAYLHKQGKAFYTALFYEYIARVINSFEYLFILWALAPQAGATFLDALMILALSSLLGNLLFFFPMQLGVREGSLSLIIKMLFPTMSTSIGLLTSFYTRIRELFWIFVGVMLVKMANKKNLE